MESMETKGTSSADAASARETLQAIRDTEARTKTVQPVPWLRIVAVCLCFGTGVLLIILGNLWGFLAMLGGMAGIVWIEMSAKRGVRTAMKQEVQEDPRFNWKTALVPLLAYPVMMLAQAAGTTASVIIVTLMTVGAIAAYGLTWNKYHD